jgi:hypothetical protein
VSLTWANRITYASAGVCALAGTWFLVHGNWAGAGWLAAAMWAGVLPYVASLARWAGYERARAELWARASEARTRGFTIIEWVSSEIERDMGGLYPPEG